MAKQSTWQVKLDGEMHTCTLKYGMKTGYTLNVDGVDLFSARPNWIAMLSGSEFPFEFNGRKLLLVISPNSNKGDIVADGCYLSTGKPYIPLPKWAWIFIFPLFPLVITGGAIGAMCGILGFGICAKLVRNSSNTKIQILLCVIMVVLTWVAYFIIASLFMALLKR